MSNFNLKCKYCHNDLQPSLNGFTFILYKCKPMFVPTIYVLDDCKIAAISFGCIYNKYYEVWLNIRENMTQISNVEVNKDYSIFCNYGPPVYSCKGLLPLTPFNINEKLPIYLAFL